MTDEDEYLDFNLSFYGEVPALMENENYTENEAIKITLLKLIQKS
jgi:hypothetical protein